MDAQLYNDIVSTSIGGAAGGAVAGLALYLVQNLHAVVVDCIHGRRVYTWLKIEAERPGSDKFRSTRAIASYTNLPEDRVRYLCSHHKKIFLSTGNKEDLWTLSEREPQYQLY